MKNSPSLFLCALLLSCSHCLKAQTPQSAPAVQLQAVKPLRKGVDAWPLIASPSTPEQQHINATLTRLSGHMQQALKDCDSGSDGGSGAWDRKIIVTMSGPRYLSMVARDDIYCGGPYPSTETLARVFDLSTGKPVNWTKLIASAAAAEPHLDTEYDGMKVGTLSVPALLKMSRSRASADCKEVFDDKRSFQLWPDANSGKLIAEPFDLPHAVAACAEDLALTPDQARKMGFNEVLLTALEEAHKQRPAAPQK